MADDWNTSNTGVAAPNDNDSNEGSMPNIESLSISEAPRDVIDPRAGNEEIIQQVKEKGWQEDTIERGDWHANAAKYEWNDDFGDVTPRVPELEAMLYAGEFRMKHGSLDAFKEFEVSVAGPVQFKPVLEFADAGLHPVMLGNIKLCGYHQPTPIQSYCIPLGLQAHDIKAVAQTGSGKTAAYLIPVLSRLMGKAKKLSAPRPNIFAPGYDPQLNKVTAEPLVVVVVPTRELAIQVFDEARRLCYRSMLRPSASYGKLPFSHSLLDLGKGCDILIATPGRLCDLMDRPSVLSLRRVKFTIIDEADEMLNQDWNAELAKIMSGGDTNQDADHTFMMFSATFPQAAVELAEEYLNEDHYDIRVGRSGSTHRNITQDVVWVDKGRKQEALEALLLSLKPSRVLIFCNNRRVVDQVDDFLYNRGWPTTSIHGGRNQAEREDALRSFRAARCPILIATGVSSRGLDIFGIEHVINYDLPSMMYGGIDEYVHRIGRTARIGNKGVATSFYNDDNSDIAKALTNTLIEAGSVVPDFLQEHVHEDGKAHFDEEQESGEALDNELEARNDTADAAFPETANAPAEEAVAAW